MSTNQSNLLHLYRPAAVVFRKPLATNEEMTRELEKLLGDVAPITSNSITDLKWRGLFKAAYISPALGKYYLLGYQDNLVFHAYSCSTTTPTTGDIYQDFLNYDIVSAPIRIDTKTDIIKKAFTKFLSWALFDENGNARFSQSKVSLVGDIENKNIFAQLPIVGHIGRLMTNKTVSFLSKINKDENTPTGLYIKASEGDREEAEKWNRTWFVLSFDSEYYVPDTDNSKYSYAEFSSPLESVKLSLNYAAATNVHNLESSDPYRILNRETTVSGLRSPRLDYKVVYSAEKISQSEFSDFVDLKSMFPKVYKVLKENPIMGVYKVVFQGTADYKTPIEVTKKQALEQLNSFNNVYKGKENVEVLCNLDDFYYNYCKLQETDRNTGLDRTLQPINDWDNYSGVIESVDSSYYRIKVSSLFSKDYGDFVQKIQPGTDTLSIKGTPYDTIVNTNTSSVKYKYESGVGYLYFMYGASLNDLVTSYYLMCRNLNDTVNNTFTNVDISTLASVEEEFPLRYKHQRTTTGYIDGYIVTDDTDRVTSNDFYSSDPSDSATDKLVHINFNTALHNKALYDSYGRGRVGTKRASELNYMTRYIDGSNLTLLDFKLMYYYLIKYNVVVPKYLKLRNDFITGDTKYSPVRMFPSDFFTTTDPYIDTVTLEPIKDNPFNITEVTYSKEFDSNFATIMGQSIEEKKRLVDIFERVYFGDWSGFYYTNSTPHNEDGSVYTNTAIDKNLLTNVLNRVYIDNSGSVNTKDSLTKDDVSYVQTAGLSELVNTDVYNINISRQTMGKSQANILIKNIDNKYLYKSGLNSGDSLFEPMDEVLIYLPTYKEKLELSFKGVITSVDSINQRGYHSISITCDCPLKMIEIVRTNIKPSFSFDESEYSPIHPFTVPEDMMKSIDNWIPFMMAQGLSYFTSMLGNKDDSKLVYTVSRIDDQKTPKEYVLGPKFSDPLLSYMWYRRSNHNLDQEQAKNSFKELVNLYVDTKEYSNNEPLSSGGIVKRGIIPTRSILTNNASGNLDGSKKVDYIVYAQRSDNTLFTGESAMLDMPYMDPTTLETYYIPVDTRRPVGFLTGTMQPAFALGGSDIPLVFSEYRTNLDILMETAEKFNFFVYSDRFGRVNFVPPNVSLSSVSINNGELNLNYVLDTQDFSYNMESPNILNKQTTITQQESVDDSRIVNWLQLSGGFVQSKDISAVNAGVAITVANYPSIVKYGVHSQKQQAILGVKDRRALRAYGLALLDRSNKNFRSSNCDCIGTGDMDVNKTVYNAISNTVYLRTGMTVSYAAGKTYTSSSVLNWGRKPLCAIKVVNGTVDLVSLLNDIEVLKNTNKITYAYYSQVMSILKYIKSRDSITPYMGLLSSFIFNGYFWDGVPSISFEDLATSFYTTDISSGFDVPVFALSTFGSNTSTISNIMSVAKSIIEPSNSIGKLNLTGVDLGLFTNPTIPSIDQVYTRQNDFVLRGK